MNGAGFSTERMHLNEIKDLMLRMQEARRTLVVAHDYTRRGKDVADMIARAIAELDGSPR